MKRPVISVTMGDPAGIGAEIAAKAFSDPALYQDCRPLLIGSSFVMAKALEITGLTSLRINCVADPAQGVYQHGTIDMMDVDAGLAKDTFVYGKVSAACGRAAFEYVQTAISLAMKGQVGAVVTNPLNKEALQLAGYPYSGHTEIFADLTGARRCCMLLSHGKMLISHVSTHISLRQACDRVKKQRILDVIELTHAAVRQLTGVDKPYIAIAGLNPHSGENGLFGSEEIEEIIPAVEQARSLGYHVDGPIAPDTVFSRLRGGWYDAVVAMYHDQGHIPLKTLGFIYNAAEEKWDQVSGVNMTLGLPIVRTSVDHGTAFDQAGTGKADESSLKNAIDAAIRLSH